jgi:lysozyme
MNGIDVSHHNGVINWNSVANNTNYKVDFVFMKTTEGLGYTDPMVSTNATDAKGVGIPVGYYHFADFNSLDVNTDATNQANHFISVIKTLPAFDLPLILDIEDGSKKPTANLNPAQILQWVVKFYEVLNEQGYSNYGLYSGAYFLNTNFPSNHNMGHIPLWLAAYVKTPIIPNGWPGYWIWQFTDKGSVNGISTPVDVNLLQGTLTPNA